MERGGGDVRITCITEDAEVLVRGCGAKESDMRVGSTDRLRGGDGSADMRRCGAHQSNSAREVKPVLATCE
jgi:hypothetical protein